MRVAPGTRRGVVGAVASFGGLGAAFAAGASPSVGVLAAWDVGATVFLLWVWTTIAGMDATATAGKASGEDDSYADEVVLVSASIASLVAVAFTLIEAGHADGQRRAALTALAVASVLLAWAAVHTVHVLRYARLYYMPPVGGIDFHDDEPPDYLDLAYLALTIGMAFQVSDTDISQKRIRRVAIKHALLSYLFGTVILSVTVSSVAALLGS
jgi:uncharacterized membrane protein